LRDCADADAATAGDACPEHRAGADRQTVADTHADTATDPDAYAEAGQVTKAGTDSVACNVTARREHAL
jgi:hypothetical protein